MDDFLYKLVIIFFPGIMGRFLLGRLVFIKENDKFYFSLHSFLIGVLSYLIFDLIGLPIFNLVFGDISGTSSFFHETVSIFSLGNGDSIRDSYSINVLTLIFVTVISCVLSLLWAWLEANECLVNFFRKRKIERREPEPYIWREFNRALKEKKEQEEKEQKLPEPSWITVYDRKNDLLYQGYLIAQSYTGASPELLLGNVLVYKSSTGEQLSELVNFLYLSCGPGERVEIEFLPTLYPTPGA